MNNAAWPLRIYYDASCPLCREEMHTLAAHDPLRRLQLVDVSPPEFRDEATAAAGIDRAALMACIHARDADGRWHRGVDVFALAYGAAGLAGVARLWSHPWLRPLWQRLYPWLARWRQPLSRIGFNRPFGAWVRWQARRAQSRVHACAEGRCEVPTHGDGR